MSPFSSHDPARAATLAPGEPSSPRAVATREVSPADVHPEASSGDEALLELPTFRRFRDRVRAREGEADVLAVRIGGERFAFDLRAIDEVVDAPPPHALPGAHPSLLGVLPLDGRSLPIFEPGAMLGTAHGRGGTILIMRTAGRPMGLVVDDVDDVERIDLCEILPPPFEGGDELLLGVHWRSGVLTSLVDARVLVGACLLSIGERRGDA